MNQATAQSLADSMADMMKAKLAETLGVDPDTIHVESGSTVQGTMDVPVLSADEIAMCGTALLVAAQRLSDGGKSVAALQCIALSDKLHRIVQSGGLVCVTPF